MSISSNPELKNLNGLSSLTSAKSLSINGNKKINDLDGLSNLISVNHLLLISDNDELDNIDGLSNLNFVSFALAVGGNIKLDMLSDYCGIYPLISNTEFPNNVSIVENGYNPTESEILELGSCMPLGIEDIDEFPIVNIYPNPAVEEITVDLISNIQHVILIEIRNTLGQLVVSEFLESNRTNISIDVRELESGMYHITILDNNNTLLHQEKLLKVEF